MRLGVRGREALVLSLLTMLVVATATAIHLSQVSRVVVQEAVKQAELIAKQIYAQTGRRSARGPAAGSRAAQLPRRQRGVLAAPPLRADLRFQRGRGAPHRASEGGRPRAGAPEPGRAAEGRHPEPLLRALQRGPHVRDGPADDAE